MMGGRLVGVDGDVEIRKLSIDSRRWNKDCCTLFVALRGPRHDAHHFIKELYEQGQRFFAVARYFPISSFPEGTFIQVSDTLEAFQRLATRHRSSFTYPVIGITGSNGKTVAKEWLHQLLRPDFSIVRSPRSYNSQVGVPLSVMGMEQNHNLAIFEAGISLPGEMSKLVRIIQPEIGILTNIGDAHDEGFSSRLEKIQEKLKLFEQAERIICNTTDKRVLQLLAAMGKKPITWSLNGEADLQIQSHLGHSNASTQLIADYRGRRLRATVPFTDQASLENVACCWLVLLELGVSGEEAVRRLQFLEPIAMRLELIEGEGGCRLINDSYNSDLTSLSIALDFMDQQAISGKRTLILSDIEQTGRSVQELYKEVAAMVYRRQVDRLIGIGSDIRSIRQYLNPCVEFQYYPDVLALLKAVDNIHFFQETILIKGARVFQFEKITRRLARKQHQAVLEVNLTAMMENLTKFQSRLHPATKLMVMVKASAYGTGSEEVARMLEYHKVDYLAVAYTDEGVQLREAGIQSRILVLNPDPEDWSVLFQFNLEPEIYSLELLDSFLNYSRTQPSALPIHLKLDTGMNRLGFAGSAMDALCLVLQKEPILRVASIFSHLSAAENPAEDPFTVQQISEFSDRAAQLSAILGYVPARHILNTAGIIRFPQYQFEMVRLGVGVFGVNPVLESDLVLRPAISLKARIAQLKNLKPGDTVGYGRLGRIDKPTSLAIIRIGYADGLLRVAGNEAYELVIRGKKAPILGNICMDMCMVDVSSIEDVEVGDPVEVFGPKQPIENLSKILDTIPYEVLTNISMRVKRLYLQE